MKILPWVLAALFMSTTTFATVPACYAPSPHWDELGDEYFNLDHTFKIGNQQKKALKKLLEPFRGKWEGTLIETNCAGPDRAPKREVLKSNTSVTINVSTKPVITISLKKKAPGSRTTRSDVIDLLVENVLFRFKNERSGLSAAEKSRNRNRFAEYISTIKRDGERLHIGVLLYIHGVFVHSQVMTLNPD